MFDPNYIQIETEYLVKSKMWYASFSEKTCEKYNAFYYLNSHGNTESEAIYNLRQLIQNKMDFYTDVYNAIKTNYGSEW